MAPNVDLNGIPVNHRCSFQWPILRLSIWNPNYCCIIILQIFGSSCLSLGVQEIANHPEVQLVHGHGRPSSHCCGRTVVFSRRLGRSKKSWIDVLWSKHLGILERVGVIQGHCSYAMLNWTYQAFGDVLWTPHLAAIQRWHGTLSFRHVVWRVPWVYNDFEFRGYNQRSFVFWSKSGFFFGNHQ